MIQILKGIIFGKPAKTISDNEISSLTSPHQPLIATVNSQKDPNHQREILRREAKLKKKS